MMTIFCSLIRFASQRGQKEKTARVSLVSAHRSRCDERHTAKAESHYMNLSSYSGDGKMRAKMVRNLHAIATATAGLKTEGYLHLDQARIQESMADRYGSACLAASHSLISPETRASHSSSSVDRSEEHTSEIQSLRQLLIPPLL